MKHKADHSFLAGSSGMGGGELAEMIRSRDWSRTPLGPVESWPQSLRTAVSLCLASNFPINIIWGPEHTQIYNDGYRDCCGDVHPRALGEDYRITWASAWPVIGESFERALAGETMYLENRRMFLRRLNGALEETFFTFSHSPIRNESGSVGGLFHPVAETTGTMLSARRTCALRDLSAKLGTANDEPDVAQKAVEVLARFEFDLPFVLFYRLDPKIGTYRLAGCHGVAAGLAVTPTSIAAEAASPWPFGQALAAQRMIEVGDLQPMFRGVPCGPYEEPPSTAFVIPIVVPTAETPPAVIVAGTSPRLRLTQDYRSLYDLIAVTVSGALATVRAREDERRRAEALAEIDRAKTLFFSNVSHEFRTPLTLMLGPLQDALAGGDLSLKERERLDLAHRNSLRLLKLVNSLLDFSRIEAGRAQAAYVPVDLAAVTADLASSFRSACERAGLNLVVDCPPLPQSVYVDRDMWEKIVLNLLSNAFKFTFAGEIAVRLRTVDGHAELSVSDTGVGIPQQELPRVFERFHRVEGQKSRTYEGSGIGLALVQELVRLHGGVIRAESTENQGARFSIQIPFGVAHLSQDRVGGARNLASSAVGAEAYVEEALRWLPDPPPQTGVLSEIEGSDAVPSLREGVRILVADDNADMRAYIRQLLAGNREVKAVADGQAALESIRQQRPDLVLTDVMMPRLDGLSLLHAIRADATIRDVPVIMLSARADEESRLEGLKAGADDYLTKPFSGRELIARVAAALKLAHVRREATAALRESEARLQAIFSGACEYIGILSPDGTLLDTNRASLEFANSAREDVVGRPFWDTVWFVNTPGAPEKLRESIARAAGGEFIRYEAALARPSGEIMVFDFSLHPVKDENGNVILIVPEGRDITKRKRAEQKVVAQKQILEMVATRTPLTEILDTLMLLVESQEPGMISGLLLTDENARFLAGRGPSLPSAYKLALHEANKTLATTPPYFATCHEAVDCGRIASVSDVAKDKRYARKWRELMLAAGLRAVRSTPVRGSHGRVLGCLALYFPDARDPNPSDPELVDMATHLASIAIERDQASRALQHRTTQFETLLNQAPIGVYLVDSEFRIREANPIALSVFGEIFGGVLGRDFDEVIHILWEKPYADEIVRIFRHALETGESFATPQRAEFRADRAVMEYYEWRLDRIVLPDGSFGLVCYFRDIAEQVQAETTRQLLLRELNHRVKNTLASVQAIVQQTLRTTREPADFAARFSGRVQSLARVHSLLTDATWQGAGLRELIRDQLLQGPIDDSRLTAWGPAVRLQPQAAVHLALMLHELGTNCVKYGALSSNKGWVTISWTVMDDVLNLEWVERAGPPVSAPTKRGFGTTLIEHSAKSAGGKAQMLCEPEGVTWRISLVLPSFEAGDTAAGMHQAELVRPATRQSAEAVPAKRRARLAGLRLLVVEDEPLIGLDLADRLEEAGAEVAPPVGTEREALQIIENGDFDAALLDANLHGRSVNEIAAALTRRNVPFVFITGYGREGLPRSFTQAPALAKPVSDQQLFDAITAIVPRPDKIAQLNS